MKQIKLISKTEKGNEVLSKIWKQLRNPLIFFALKKVNLSIEMDNNIITFDMSKNPKIKIMESLDKGKILDEMYTLDSAKWMEQCHRDMTRFGAKKDIDYTIEVVK